VEQTQAPEPSVPVPTQADNDKDDDDSNSDDDNPLACTESKHTKGPFCSPKDGELWYVGGDYEVTWNKNQWGANNTEVYITLKYVEFGNSGQVASSVQSPRPALADVY
jgi:hypothetical protein